MIREPFFLRRHDWISGLALLVVTLAAYQPAWNGRLLWDDNGHITKPELRTPGGLARIWTTPGATQQYYPVVHSVFWLEYHLWRDSTPGYHLLNIFLHVFSALLFLQILRLLKIPGAWFIAALFALHPAQVESVAWITELKNTLSGVFFFGTALTYLKFDGGRQKKWYALALCLFVLGLFSKSVIATLPVSLLAVFWWKRGRIVWKKEVLPLLPFFALGVIAGLFTVWAERRFIIGARGGEFDFSVIERCLIAGRAIWFYLGKIVWPVNLMFIYPRWNVDAAVWRQYLFPAAALALVCAFWALRKRSRAPLAAFVCYAAALFPVLGFFNVYPFRFSFVADHFQYLACTGPLALAAAGIGSSLRFVNQNARRTLIPAVCGAILLTLAVLTFRQAGQYADAETLYRTTIRKNDACWMAHNNLGIILADAGRTGEAAAHYRAALDINPRLAEAENNLGSLLAKAGQTGEAIACFRKALKINPQYGKALYNLGGLCAKAGQTGEAVIHLRKALAIDPRSAEALNKTDYAGALNALGDLHQQAGRNAEAIDLFRRALEICPGDIDAQYNLGNALLQAGRTGEAAGCYRKVLDSAPGHVDARYNLGNTLLQTGRIDEAITCYSRVVEISPGYTDALNNLALAYLYKGQRSEAIGFLERALAAARAAGQKERVRIIEGDLDKLQGSRND